VGALTIVVVVAAAAAAAAVVVVSVLVAAACFCGCGDEGASDDLDEGGPVVLSDLISSDPLCGLAAEFSVSFPSA
jgi:hypothetical protein